MSLLGIRERHGQGDVPALCPETAAKGFSLQTRQGQRPGGQHGEGPAGAAGCM